MFACGTGASLFLAWAMVPGGHTGFAEKAKNCYEDSLLLDPTDSITANLLRQINEELGLQEQAAAAAGLAANVGNP